MTVAALYDIHGNLPALRAVLQEIESLPIDQLVVGGDVVVGPMSRQCLDLLLEVSIPTVFIRGNCEVAVLNQMDGKPPDELPPAVLEDIYWTAAQLLPAHRDIMKTWPMTFNVEITGAGEVLFCHATPRSVTEIFTRLTPEKKLLPIFQRIDAKVVVCGHTHMQFDRYVGRTRVVNAGSVGMPFGDPGAYWLMLGSNIQLRRTAYDLAGAAEQIMTTRYPNAEDFAKNNVMQPPSEKVMLELFEN